VLGTKMMAVLVLFLVLNLLHLTAEVLRRLWRLNLHAACESPFQSLYPPTCPRLLFCTLDSSMSIAAETSKHSALEHRSHLVPRHGLHVLVLRFHDL
jgi:hypothetical protein